MDAQAPHSPSIPIALLSGAAAGTTVDIALFPLDTIKTRLQSAQGFWKAGGFRGIYSGLSAAAVGSAPGAALFFGTYEASKGFLRKNTGLPDAVVHMASAATGEVVACIVRVPTEIVKQRLQAGIISSMVSGVRDVYSREGITGFYRGYWATVLREIPFSLIQFPLYEYLKQTWARNTHRKEVTAQEAALCGCASGAVSAAITTPLDVAKTRVMLAQNHSGHKYAGTLQTLRMIHAEGGIRGLFAGVTPRVTWIGIGGFVFFGSYEEAKGLLTHFFA